MEKKASINKPLMIIAAVLSGVGAVLSTTLIVERMRLGYYPVHMVMGDILLIGAIFIFAAMTALIAAEKLPPKWLVLPLGIYFMPTIFQDIYTIARDFEYMLVYSWFLFLWIALFSLLVLTVCGVLKTKIPVIVVLGAYFLLCAVDFFTGGYFNAYSLGLFLYDVAILLSVIALPSGKGSVSNGEQQPELIEEQNLALCIVLSIVTCGIYGLVWEYQIVRKIRLLNGESTDCVGEYLCLILVPFYFLYWYYTRSQKLCQGMKKVGAPASDNSVVNMVLALFGLSIVSDALIQNDLNKAAGILQVRSRTVPVEVENSVSTSGEDAVQAEAPSEDKAEPADKNVALLQQLAELHDKGILSDEEFEEKKKDLLNRI